MRKFELDHPEILSYKGVLMPYTLFKTQLLFILVLVGHNTFWLNFNRFGKEFLVLFGQVHITRFHVWKIKFWLLILFLWGRGRDVRGNFQTLVILFPEGWLPKNIVWFLDHHEPLIIPSFINVRMILFC